MPEIVAFQPQPCELFSVFLLNVKVITVESLPHKYYFSSRHIC